MYADTYPLYICSNDNEIYEIVEIVFFYTFQLGLVSVFPKNRRTNPRIKLGLYRFFFYFFFLFSQSSTPISFDLNSVSFIFFNKIQENIYCEGLTGHLCFNFRNIIGQLRYWLLAFI